MFERPTGTHIVLYLPKITRKCMWITCTCTPTPTPQFQSSYTTYGHNAPLKSRGLPNKTLGTKHKNHPFELSVSALSFLPEFKGKTDPICWKRHTLRTQESNCIWPRSCLPELTFMVPGVYHREEADQCATQLWHLCATTMTRMPKYRQRYHISWG